MAGKFQRPGKPREVQGSPLHPIPTERTLHLTYQSAQLKHMSKTTKSFNLTLNILNWNISATNKLIPEVKLKNYCSDV